MIVHWFRLSLDCDVEMGDTDVIGPNDFIDLAQKQNLGGFGENVFGNLKSQEPMVPKHQLAPSGTVTLELARAPTFTARRDFLATASPPRRIASRMI
jgi:hypothetical protein